VHEAGLLAAAVASALARPPRPGPPLRLEVTVRDPVHLAPEAARLHAEVAMRSRGLLDVPIEVSSEPVSCTDCGMLNDARPDRPFCTDCGWPLPPTPGDPVVAVMRW
jgi:hypothetical protein